MEKLPRNVRIDPKAPGGSGTMKLKVPLNYGDIIRDALQISGADTQQQAQAYEKMEKEILQIEYGPSTTVVTVGELDLPNKSIKTPKENKV